MAQAPPPELIGRRRELALACAVLAGGRHLLVEGPPGVGKTALATSACARLGRVTVRVDGDDGLTPDRLAGWFDPPLLLRSGYRAEAFTAGPLTVAVREGRILLANDLDRLPEAAQNLLLPALDEGLLQVPRLGTVTAAPGFLVVATRGGGDARGSGEGDAGRIPEALRDRFELLSLEYQSEEEECEIVRARTWSEDEELVRAAVSLTRATRSHPALSRGASVRAAISATSLAARLGGISGLRRAAAAALYLRVEVDAAAGRALTDVIDELVDEVVAAGSRPVIRANAAARRHTAVEAAAGASGLARPDPEPGLDPAAVCSRDVRRDLAARLSLRVDDLDGWDMAARLSAGRLPCETASARLCAEQLAAAAVLARARRLVGPLRASTRPVRSSLTEPHLGELCLEPTLENILGKPWAEEGDLIVERREERRREVVLIIDTSLSMAGEKMALAAVAAAALALKLHPGDLAVVLFSDEARVVVRLREQVAVREIVRRMLARPCGGATHVAAALETGLAELRRGRDPRRSAVLVSDGVYTAGPDPRPVAARFTALHVLLTAEREQSRPPSPARDLPGRATGLWISPRRVAGRDVAAAGGGRVVPVESFRALPRRMVDLADHVLR